MPPEESELELRFTYHAPHGDQLERYTLIREQFLELALAVKRNTPASREQSLAFTALEEACMFANAAIARREAE